ncbi:TPA: lipid carrier--UDP-N-acetylgalactosaminyltransferase [Candidatus Wolfebacteria bacterium]|nr:lipid carrier--UDP-N-acetylgalactosaminyltransferase [Candidatus Wolfebacteria bacterium]
MFALPAIILSPLIAAIIKYQDNGPIFYRQKRFGENGKIFTITKFRTMNTNSENSGPKFTEKNDNRITKFGKFLRDTRIDELPQIINVLKGEMSFIGPRPLLIEYLPLYNNEQKRRHNVLPGITGWAQVNGRNAISWEQKFKYDVWYVDHQSFLLDMQILWMTFLKVLHRSDINSKNSATMEKFKGNEK